MQLLLSIDEIAKALHVSRRTAYALRSKAAFPKPVTVSGRCVRYKASDLAAFVETLSADNAPPEPPHLKAGRARKVGAGGGTKNPKAVDPRPSMALAEGVSVEPPMSNSIKVAT